MKKVTLELMLYGVVLIKTTVYPGEVDNRKASWQRVYGYKVPIRQT